MARTFPERWVVQILRGQGREPGIHGRSVRDGGEMKARSMALSQKEAWRIYELLEQLNDFLHRPENYRTRADIVKWLQSGVYEELRKTFYGIAAKWFPVDEDTGRVRPPSGVHRRFPE